MKKLVFSSLFIVFSLILVAVLRSFLPKYTGMLVFFLIFLLLDVYLWFYIRKTVNNFSRWVRGMTTMLFWLPVALLLLLICTALFIPFLDWSLPLRTYLQSFILILFIGEVFPILLLVIADFIRLATYAIKLVIHGKRDSFTSTPRLKPLLWAGWIMGTMMLSIMAAGIFFWQFDFKIKQQVIPLKQLPQVFDGLKIAQFSDVHLGSWGSKTQLQKAMDEINGLHPDVIFFTGDMFNYRTADGKGFETILKSLHAPFGIYAIMGNHDYGDYLNWPSEAAKKQNFEDVKTFYKHLGWRLLLNSHDILKRGNDSIAVIGVENWGETKRFQRHGDIALAQAGTENIAIQLLLSHDPTHWDSIISKKYRSIDVTFSGHTHGGQFGIDIGNIHWSPIVWFCRLWCGLYKNPDNDPPQYLYVNQGLGNIGYSGRVGIMPEITLIILKRD